MTTEALDLADLLREPEAPPAEVSSHPLFGGS
jgi:hypothetical protein